MTLDIVYKREEKVGCTCFGRSSQGQLDVRFDAKPQYVKK